MPPAALVVGAVASVVGTVMSVRAQRKAAKLSAQQQRNAQRREALKAARAAQISRAQATASAVGAGAMGSSAQAGGVASISTRLGSALGYQSMQGSLTQGINAANQRAQMGSGIANLGGSIFQMAGTFSQTAQGQQLGVPDYSTGLRS